MLTLWLLREHRFLKPFTLIYLWNYPVSNISQFQLPRGVSHRQAVERALSSLGTCGCYQLWQDFTRQSVAGKSHLVEYSRYDLCIKEQCWSNQDIDDCSLTENDKLVPFPDIVRRILFAKRTAARSRKQTAMTEANEARRALVERHTDCRPGPGRCLDNVFEATHAIAEAQYSSRLTEIKNEINILINNSAWRRHVDADRVCNLHTGLERVWKAQKTNPFLNCRAHFCD